MKATKKFGRLVYYYGTHTKTKREAQKEKTFYHLKGYNVRVQKTQGRYILWIRK